MDKPKPNQKIQDVVPKRSIRDIPVSREVEQKKKDDPLAREREFLIERLSKKSHQTKPPVDEEVYQERAVVYEKTKIKTERSFSFAKLFIWGIALIAILFLIFAITFFFAGATVTVIPKHATVPINSNLTAFANASSTSGTVLPYQVLMLVQDDKQPVAATVTPDAPDKKASGQIIVYNNYSVAPQTLVANTRFSTPTGLIYRISSTIKVPGYTTIGGKSTPGSITATVYADQPGSQYNIDLTDFTIPGFAGDTQRSTKIFARSKTPMTGGSSKGGTVIAPADLTSAKATLESRLKDELVQQAQAQKSADSLFYENGYTIDYQMLPQTPQNATSTFINERATLHAILFNKELLSRALLGDTISSVGNNVGIRGLDSLTFTPTTLSTKPLWQQNPLMFSVSGSIDVVGVVDIDALKKDLLGTPKASLNSVLAKYPTIQSANASIRPFWQQSFPGDATKIKIDLANPTQ